MTEQEAEALAARLTRIWGVDESGLVYEPFDHAFFGRLNGGVKFHCWFVPEKHVLHPYTVTVTPLEGHIGLDYLNGEIYAGRQPSEKEFAREWMFCFRRGCWLSGCPLEASAHEKAEWIRGFTSEEIESWDLNL